MGAVAVAVGASSAYRGRSGGGARGGRVGTSAVAGGWPPAGAVVAGMALAVACLVVASAVLGVLQSLGWVVWTPPWLHALGTYLSVAAGGWCAGRLAGRRGALVGLWTGVLVCALAVWVGGTGWAGPSGPTGGTDGGGLGAWWRVILVVALAAVGGALGVAPL